MSRKKILKYEDLKNFIPVTIGDRIICIIAEKYLNGAAFCKIMNISAGNLNGLINDDNKPSTDFNLRLLEHFKVNINWLLTGEGEKYIKNIVTAYPKGVFDDLSDQISNETIYNKDRILDDDPVINELLMGARNVLKSGNKVAYEALERNIRYFSHAVDAEKRLDESDDRTKRLEEKCDQLIDEISRLKKRMDKMNSTGEGEEESKERKAI